MHLIVLFLQHKCWGIRMISQVSYGSSNQSTLPETYYQFWIGQSGINTSCEMWWCNRWIWLIIRNLLSNGLALAIPSPRVCILNVSTALHDLGELCITIHGWMWYAWVFIWNLCYKLGKEGCNLVRSLCSIKWLNNKNIAPCIWASFEWILKCNQCWSHANKRWL